VCSVHYRALRVSVQNYKGRINCEKLEMMCQRASPKQWSKYAISTIVIKCLHPLIKQPTKLVNFPSETLFTERRYPDVTKFFSNSKGKFGRQKLGNNLEFMNATKDKWLNNHTLTPDRLKRSFFSYLNVPYDNITR
jgi:hypothetical protein